MPHFTLNISPVGPLVRLFFAVAEPRAIALQQAGVPVPAPTQGWGLVDTGASNTCVDPAVIAELSLQPTGQVQVHTPSTGDGICIKSQFDIAIAIPGMTGMEQPLWLPSLPVTESELLKQQQIHALIGRDILQYCVLIYNGGSQQFTVSF